MPTSSIRLTAAAAAMAALAHMPSATAQQRWDRPQQSDLPPLQSDQYQPPAATPQRGARANDAYSPPPERPYPQQGGYQGGYPQSGYQQGGAQTGYPAQVVRPNDAYAPPARQPGYGEGAPPPAVAADPRGGYGQPYSAPAEAYEEGPRGGPPGRYSDAPPPQRTYSQNEVLDTGHRFFGSISQGLASAVEYVFQQAGRPNGYILGEDAGGAFVAGLRYGEGTLYTKDAGNHRVYWQGPSLGYDFGGEGSKTMVLVYNLRDVSEIYNRFGGVQGSAYLVGGVSVQFQKFGDVVLAPIRSGVGLRLGANVGYLKYTRTPTWNPF